MARQTAGIVALVLGVFVLVWPSATSIVLGILLLLMAVGFLTGKLRM